MVYLGRLRDGSWSTGTVAAKAVAGQKAAPGDVEFTVFDPDRMQVRARIEEKQLHLLGIGLAGGVEPTGYPDAVLPVTLGPFAAVSRDGGFDAVFAVAAKEGGPKLLPGMTGAVRCVIVRRQEALTLPATAVFRDDDGGRHVYRVNADGGWEKRSVKTGRSTSDRAEERIEIFEGLAAGDRVRTKKP
jgi:multidrug efflux pump subunit AcrA (membrane-fusion protein)